MVAENILGNTCQIFTSTYRLGKKRENNNIKALFHTIVHPNVCVQSNDSKKELLVFDGQTNMKFAINISIIKSAKSKYFALNDPYNTGRVECYCICSFVCVLYGVITAPKNKK